MWAARAFTPRYFAPRYFAKAGEDPVVGTGTGRMLLMGAGGWLFWLMVTR